MANNSKVRYQIQDSTPQKKEKDETLKKSTFTVDKKYWIKLPPLGI
jgi:hypothetical protein